MNTTPRHFSEDPLIGIEDRIGNAAATYILITELIQAGLADDPRIVFDTLADLLGFDSADMLNLINESNTLTNHPRREQYRAMLQNVIETPESPDIDPVAQLVLGLHDAMNPDVWDDALPDNES